MLTIEEAADYLNTPAQRVCRLGSGHELSRQEVCGRGAFADIHLDALVDAERVEVTLLPSARDTTPGPVVTAPSDREELVLSICDVAKLLGRVRRPGSMSW